MRTYLITASILGLMLVASAQETPPKASEKIPATQAKNHIGSEKIVTGRIVEVNKAEKLVRLNFEKPFPKQSFTAVIFAGKTNLFPDIEKLKDKTVEVSGKITDYNDRPQIVLLSTNQLKIVEKPAVEK